MNAWVKKEVKQACMKDRELTSPLSGEVTRGLMRIPRQQAVLCCLYRQINALLRWLLRVCLNETHPTVCSGEASLAVPSFLAICHHTVTGIPVWYSLK